VTPLRLFLLAFAALALATSLVLCVRERGWRRGALRFADTVCWCAIPIVTGELLSVAGGAVAALCWVPVCFAAGWWGRSMLGVLNFLVLQWFGVRLARVEVPGRMRVVARREVRAGQLASAADVDMSTAEPVRRWSLLRWVWPLTGWSPYRWIGVPRRSGGKARA
jgi:hypothetical protein